MGAFSILENDAFKAIASKYALCSCTSNFWDFIAKKLNLAVLPLHTSFFISEQVSLDIEFSSLGNDRYILQCAEVTQPFLDKEVVSHMKFITLFSEGYWIWDIEKGIVETDSIVRRRLAAHFLSSMVRIQSCFQLFTPMTERSFAYR